MIVFAVAGAFTLHGRAIAAATVAQLRRGLCLVGGHDCADPHEPCSVSSRGSASDMNVDVALVRLGGGSAALIDHRSDGKVLVTVTDHLDAGISVGVGGQLEIGGRPALGGELRGAAIAGLGHGTAYVVSNDSQAEALLRLLHRPKVDPSFYTPAVRAYWRRVESVLPRIPAPTTRYRSVEGGLSLAGGAIVEKLIKVSTKGPKTLIVWADPLLMGQALLNLILNAVQASESGGALVVEFAADADEGKQFRLAIEDGGPGIMPEIMDKIFDPFFTTKDEGTGLGLAIVHRVVEAHEGTISAINRDGGGARFEIRI